MQGILESEQLWEVHSEVLKGVIPKLCDFGSSRFFISWGPLLFKIYPKMGLWAERELYYLKKLQCEVDRNHSILEMTSSSPVALGDYKAIILKDLRRSGGGVSLWDSMKNPVRDFEVVSGKLQSLWQAEAFEKAPCKSQYSDCYSAMIQEVHKLLGESKSIYLDSNIVPQHTASHGDLHLGQFLSTDSSQKEYVLHDFEGVPFSDLGERYFSHLWGNKTGDLASLLRSVDYWYRVQKNDNQGLTPLRRESLLESLGVPQAELQCLSYANLVRNLYEIAYEEKCRPGMVKIPTAGLATSIEWVNSFKL